MSVAERLAALEGSGIKLGLANIAAICGALDHPERAYTTVHVAGTNGKGSVVAMVHAALLAAGHRAARYTSPHLRTIHERFVVGDAPVGDAAFTRVGTAVLDRIDALVRQGALAGPPTYFEATTAIAFALFRDAATDIAVIEVGLGGRFDSTNVVTPAVTAITSIALDHEAFLGRNRAAIAFEKAGIVKPGVPLVLGHVPPEAEAVIRAVAGEQAAPVVEARHPRDGQLDPTGGHARLVPGTGPLAGQTVTVGLAGAHQAGNAWVAYRVLEQLDAGGVTHLSAQAARAGLEHAGWAGRLELRRGPGARLLLLDAAHNPAGAEALAAHLRLLDLPAPTLVFAAMHDKDIAGMLAWLLPVVGTVVLAPLPGHRAADPEDVAARVRAADPDRAVVVVPDVAAALDTALGLGRDVVVAGSIVLVGEARGAADARAILR